MNVFVLNQQLFTLGVSKGVVVLNHVVFEKLNLKKRWVDALVGVSDLPEFKAKLTTILSRKDSNVRSDLISLAGPAERRLKKEKRHLAFKQRGYSVEIVDRRNQIPYAFSVGLSNRIGYELILSYPGDPSQLEAVVEMVSRTAIVGVGTRRLIPNEVATLPDISVKGEPLRFVINKKTEPGRVVRHKAPVMSSRRYVQRKPKHIYQILIGDENNLLPGEDGYNEAFTQNLHHPEDRAY